ncbi:hypothetical protein P692DRAFT_201851247 [Suillus brevipes Sb2]|nr:hypothetical protein P692DRAFT_201851247 [Suillus brevipes Sb2]
MLTISDSEAKQILLCTYFVLAGNSILMYDHVMTLSEEITFIWRRPKALSAMLFVLNRYLALLGMIYSLLMQPFLVSDEVCSKYTAYRQLVIFFQGIIICIIMAIRTYALYGCSRCLLALMTIIIIALVGVACAVTFAPISNSAVILPRVGCYEAYTAKTYAILFATLCACSEVAADPPVRCISGKAASGTRRLTEFSPRSFRAMALISIPNILTYYSGSVAIRGSLCTFTSCISVTLISRLMLNLHKTIDTGIFSTIVRDDDHFLTTGVDVPSAISSHH